LDAVGAVGYLFLSDTRKLALHQYNLQRKWEAHYATNS